MTQDLRQGSGPSSVSGVGRKSVNSAMTGEQLGSDAPALSTNRRIRCDICGAAAATLCHDSRAAKVYACRVCTGLFSRLASGQENFDAYDQQYFKVYRDRRDAQIEVSRNILTLLQKVEPDGSLLDYGCGTGVFLRLAGEFGYSENCGADTSEAALSGAASELGVVKDVELVNLRTGQLPLRRFNVITFLDSIAHIQNLDAVMTTLLNHHLAPGGKILIRTPRINMLYRIYARLAAAFLPSAFADSLYYIPNRLILFNETALRVFFKRYGLEVMALHRNSDYRSTSQVASLKRALRSSFKHTLRSLLVNRLPSLLNPNNSMLAIVKSVGPSV